MHFQEALHVLSSPQIEYPVSGLQVDLMTFFSFKKLNYIFWVQKESLNHLYFKRAVGFNQWLKLFICYHQKLNLSRYISDIKNFVEKIVQRVIIVKMK